MRPNRSRPAVALKYHSPGCGIGDVAEFTVNPGDNQRTTQVLSADLQSGKVKASTTVEGQVTSVVPTPDGPVGVMGSTLVRIPEKGTAAGRPVRLATVSGLAYDLRPAAAWRCGLRRAAGRGQVVADHARAVREAVHAG